MSLSEEMTTKDIQALCGVSKNRALEIRKEAINYCLANGINLIGIKVPTEAVLHVTNKDIAYYCNKMKLEAQAI